jgi:hypothetical protein
MVSLSKNDIDAFVVKQHNNGPESASVVISINGVAVNVLCFSPNNHAKAIDEFSDDFLADKKIGIVVADGNIKTNLDIQLAIPSTGPNNFIFQLK